MLSQTDRYQKNKVMDSFESLLEKEHLMLLDFDDEVESFEVQPVRIPVTGVRNGYVPDVLVKFLPDSETGEIRRPLLAEVKHSDELNLHWFSETFKTKGKRALCAHASVMWFCASTFWAYPPKNCPQIHRPELYLSVG